MTTRTIFIKNETPLQAYIEQTLNHFGNGGSSVLIKGGGRAVNQAVYLASFLFRHGFKIETARIGSRIFKNNGYERIVGNISILIIEKPVKEAHGEWERK